MAVSGLSCWPAWLSMQLLTIAAGPFRSFRPKLARAWSRSAATALVWNEFPKAAHLRSSAFRSSSSLSGGFLSILSRCRDPIWPSWSCSPPRPIWSSSTPPCWPVAVLAPLTVGLRWEESTRNDERDSNSCPGCSALRPSAVASERPGTGASGWRGGDRYKWRGLWAPWEPVLLSWWEGGLWRPPGWGTLVPAPPASLFLLDRSLGDLPGSGSFPSAKPLRGARVSFGPLSITRLPGLRRREKATLRTPNWSCCFRTHWMISCGPSFSFSFSSFSWVSPSNHWLVLQLSSSPAQQVAPPSPLSSFPSWEFGIGLFCYLFLQEGHGALQEERQHLLEPWSPHPAQSPIARVSGPAQPSPSQPHQEPSLRDGVPGSWDTQSRASPGVSAGATCPCGWRCAYLREQAFDGNDGQHEQMW